MRTLLPGEAASFTVDAERPWNASGIHLESGARYELEASVVDGEKWRDASICSTLAKGWTGPARLIEPLVRLRARARELPMYALVGAIDDDASSFFLIGNKAVLVASRAGQLQAFANDWPGRYENNHGRAEVRVVRRA